MRYKLTYKVGLTTVQEWIFTTRNLAYWKKMNLLESGSFNSGNFLITPL